jgi:hypothetical protein
MLYRYDSQDLKQKLYDFAVEVVRHKKLGYWKNTHYPQRDAVQNAYDGALAEYAVCDIFGVPFNWEVNDRGDGGRDFKLGPLWGQSKFTKYRDGRVPFFPWDKLVADLIVASISPKDLQRHDVEIYGWTHRGVFESDSYLDDYLGRGTDIPRCLRVYEMAPFETLLTLARRWL